MNANEYVSLEFVPGWTELNWIALLGFISIVYLEARVGNECVREFKSTYYAAHRVAYSN